MKCSDFDWFIATHLTIKPSFRHGFLQNNDNCKISDCNRRAEIYIADFSMPITLSKTPRD